MFKRFLRCISTLLVLVMLVNMVPVQALGELQAGEIGQISGTDQITTPETAESATIVAEVPEGRSEYTKEFLLSNGLHMATVYAEPVHYEKEGKWEDIDNTLVANIDGTYKNTAGPWEVSFPQSFGSSQSISVTKDGYTLSFGMPQRLTSGGNSGAVVMSADSTAEPLAAAQAATVTAQVDSKVALVKEKLEAEHPETVLDKLSSRLTYENVHSDTNVIYDLTSNQVKESIVLVKQDAALRGFRYTLNVGTMIPALEEDGTILFYNEDQTQIVMVMPAPYLLDAVYEISNDVAVTLTGSSGVYTLTYVLPQQWLAAEERQWPVILDPVIQTSIDRSNIQDVLVCSNATISPYGSYLEVGYLESRGISRTYVNFTNLPTLTSADVVVKAEMQMTQMWRRSISVPAEVHKVTSQWEQETITWNDQPRYEETIVDFVMGNDPVDYYWDVTDIVQEWYNDGEHYGLLFKTSDDIENAGVEKFRQFYSANYGYDYRPVLKIAFRNSNGLEGYWDYTSASAGRAGTAYVNNYCGNLVFTHSLMGFGGNRAPVSIGLTYNTNDISDSNPVGFGRGWRSNFNQSITRYQSSSNCYIWIDEDGTSHYFIKESDTNKYTSDSSQELTLTINSSSSDRRFKLANEYGSASYFDNYGRLRYIENNQEIKSTITITYKNFMADSVLINTITDGAGRVYQFYYSNALVTNVVFYGTETEVLEEIKFSFSNSNLSAIEGFDGKSTLYEYNDKNLLKSAVDVDGYHLDFDYNLVEEDMPSRILKIAEYDGTTEGGYNTFLYANNQTTITDILGNSNILQFNDFGNVTSIQDSQGRAQFADYAKNKTDEEGKDNQLTLSSKLQNTVSNLLYDSSFEDQTSIWYPTGGYESNYIPTTTEKLYGNQSLHLPSESGARTDGIMIPDSKSVTFSAYVKSNTSQARLEITDNNGILAQSETLSSGSDWTRLQVSYTNTTGSTVTVVPVIRNLGNGDVYVDCVQMEYAPTASRYNLIQNGDFRNGLNGWTATGTTADDGLVTIAGENAAEQLDDTFYAFLGNPEIQKSLSQTIAVSGVSGDNFVIAGWAKGDSVPLTDDREFGVRIRFNYIEEYEPEEGETDGTAVAQFNADVDHTVNWQFSAAAAVAKAAYSSVTVELVYDYNANTMYFDGIQLYKEVFGTSYTYNDDGDVESVIDIQNKKTEYEYDSNNNLTKIIEDDNVKMTYTYDNHHNVETATTDEGLVYNFEYDDYGNNTIVRISVTDKETQIESTISSQAVYKNNGDLLDYTLDALGNKTTYGYNEQTGLLDWVIYPENDDDPDTQDVVEPTIPTYYTYDEMYRMASATSDLYRGTVDTELNLSANYTYEDDLLKTIQTPSTTYSFTYGDFSLRTRVDVGNRNLASYSYENGTNRLQRLDYGNQDKVEYTYDSQGKLIQEEYEDGETVSYAYDNSGNLATVTDSATGVVTTYYYDLLNRQSGYREQGEGLDHTVKYEYDEDNNIASVTEIINGVTKTYSYTYDDDNRIETETVDGITVSYTYDSFGRLSQKVTSNGTTQIISESYQFTNPETGATSAQISGVIADLFEPEGAADNKTNYSYTYDGNGNILTISDGANTTSYVYDSANQLIRENNQAQGFTHIWEYNSAGNITKRTEYTYTTAEDLTSITPTDTINYGYHDDRGWMDLLTSYDDKTISYDEIGNPLNDGTWSYTWQHGRQLASMTKGTTTWTYTYGADGMRTKRSTGYYDYEYVYNGSKLASMTVDGYTHYFAYDASGTPLAMIINDYCYHYVTNLQGDVIGILDEDGNRVATYLYDAWGNVECISDHPVADYNPLTYRGYVYDWETGLYYLQSRYYNPEWGRFINADILVSTKKVGIGCNIFAYCNNNTVNYCDKNGFDAIWIQESKSAKGNGHSGLMVQDEEGNWFFFYWGPTDETPDKDLIFGAKNGSYIQEIPTNGADLHDIEVLRSTLAAAGGKAGNRANAITDIYYFEGDYTATLDAVENMVNMNEEYNLITNNCVQKTIDAFSASDSRFSMVAFGSGNYLIPNLAAFKVAMLPSNKKAFPWKLFFFNLLET